MACASLVSDCSAMTTARYRPTWDLALDPLVSCKLCLGEYPLEQMTTLAQCQCVFCTLVGRWEEACLQVWREGPLLVFLHPLPFPRPPHRPLAAGSLVPNPPREAFTCYWRKCPSQPGPQVDFHRSRLWCKRSPLHRAVEAGKAP